MSSVVVVGAINVDLVVRVAALPGPGQTAVGSDLVRNGGGKGANAAVAAAAAGAHTQLIGAVGNDDFGRFALEDLRASGVDVDQVRILDTHATGTALIVVDRHGENQIAVGAGANHAVETEAIDDAIPGAVADCVLVSTEINPAAATAAITAAQRAGAQCILNPAPVLDVLTPLIGPGLIITPNAGELRQVGDALGMEPNRPPDAVARAIAWRTGATVVVTLGSDGALVVLADGTMEHVPPSPVVEVVDTTGAGDCFNGVLAARLAAGDRIGDAVRVAVQAAGASVQLPGARPLSAQRGTPNKSV